MKLTCISAYYYLFIIKTNLLYFSHQMDQIMTKNESRSIHDAFWWNFSSFVTITNYKNKKERLTYIFIFIFNFLLNYIGIKWTKKMAKTIDKWLKIKEGCNWGHGLSASLKIGTPEKTVGALSLHSGVYYSSPFFVEKTALYNLLPS